MYASSWVEPYFSRYVKICFFSLVVHSQRKEIHRKRDRVLRFYSNYFLVCRKRGRTRPGTGRRSHRMFLKRSRFIVSWLLWLWMWKLRIFRRKGKKKNVKAEQTEPVARCRLFEIMAGFVGYELWQVHTQARPRTTTGSFHRKSSIMKGAFEPWDVTESQKLRIYCTYWTCTCNIQRPQHPTSSRVLWSHAYPISFSNHCISSPKKTSPPP